jgi:hypothetical protein
MRTITYLLTIILLVTVLFSCKKKEEPTPTILPALFSYKVNGIIHVANSSFSIVKDTTSTIYGSLNASSYALPVCSIEIPGHPSIGSYPLTYTTFWENVDTTGYFCYQGTLNITSLSNGVSGNFSFDALKYSTTFDTIHVTDGIFSNLNIYR